MIKIHWRAPQYPMDVRTWTGTHYITRKQKQTAYFRFVSHDIKLWYGISWDAKWFIGFFVFGKTKSYDSECTPPFISDETRHIYEVNNQDVF